MRKHFVMQTWLGVCTTEAKRKSFVDSGKLIHFSLTCYQQNSCIRRSTNYKGDKTLFISIVILPFVKVHFESVQSFLNPSRGGQIYLTGDFCSLFYDHVSMITLITVLSKGLRLCLKTHNLQGSRWFNITVFLCYIL